ncbi:Y' element ATP-dependent helicase protein 1 copy 1 [Saccharomyces pastorianus]|uniref:Y' element ATP-dependent helicase protein 1 copy 1 n=1 Tax=Saccharomyces pastorianus TaxID=27292 RepID=A0A6C1DSR0_SACPS|nr:Y' element ATP-dependent helicase protein 1 copy 1 [Saccharomyces pastorianus]
MPTVVDIASLILRNREVLFREPKRGIDEYLGNDSFLQMIPVKYREIVLPKLRRDTNKMTAALKNKVTVAIDELTVPLMWMVHFAVGYPYRYPELQLLALPVLSATYTSTIQQDASNCTLITTRTVHRSLD